jgi:hypothetical protein
MGGCGGCVTRNDLQDKLLTSAVQNVRRPSLLNFPMRALNAIHKTECTGTEMSVMVQVPVNLGYQ